MIGIVAPGQGSQKPGFLRSWLEIDSVADELIRLSDAAGMDLVAHGTESDAETIRDTAIAQPLLVAASIASVRVLFSEISSDVGSLGLVTAGHSVGELSCAAVAGVFDDRTVVRLAVQRGRCMAAASAAAPTGMSAVVGGDSSETLELIDDLGLTAANMNGSGQVVAAGSLDALGQLPDEVPAGTKVVPLKVAGAFHSPQMNGAADEFAAFARRLDPKDPTVPVISNADGTVVDSGAEILDRLISQVRSPVRWDLTIARLHAMGVRKIVELSPGGILTTMIRRSHPDIECVALKSAEDVEAAVSLVGSDG